MSNHFVNNVWTELPYKHIMVVISTETYNKICKFYENFNGLSYYCEQEAKKAFSDVHPYTVTAILSKEWQKHTRHQHHNIQRVAKLIMKEYRQQSKAASSDTFILLRIAMRERYSPYSMCRILINMEYANQAKAIISSMMKNPYLIPDGLLGLNVANCMYNDNFDAPIIDIVRRTIGEDYELRLKKLAADAGMEFHDEVYLRRYGYDKTPDLKLAVPCIYKGKVINWIESKASFGDMEWHQRYITDQLASYGNRFGAGIVIYWFGYLDKVAECSENGDFIFVTDDFPHKDDLVFLNLPYK